MTDQSVTAICAAIPATIFALASFLKGVQNGNKADASAKKTDALTAKAQQIHDSTNGSLQSALDKISALEEMVRDLRASAVTTEECRRKHQDEND